MPSLLYPAYQKFYSALFSLERFDKEKDFFDNISSLDNFFAEYRNITFVIQKALKNTQYFDSYISNRDKYLTDHWFVEKRNETTKQQPFQLVKQLDITVYYPFARQEIYIQSFTVENDVPLTSIIQELKSTFVKMSSTEVFFSAKFSFYEKGKEIDLWDKIISGIETMNIFMDAMYSEIGEKCLLCEQLQNRICNLKVSLLPKDFWFINDYIYYPLKEEFERGDRIAMVLSIEGKKVSSHRSLAEFTRSNYFNYDGTPFGTFVLMHAIIRSIHRDADIMPAIMVVYEDETYDLDAFHANIKTTIYRKINEVAQRILYEDIKEVFFMSLYTVLPIEKDIPLTSKERLNIATTDILTFTSVDCDLHEKEYSFDGNAFNSMEYLAYAMKNECKNKLEIGLLNMMPIIKAFRKKKEKSIND